MADVIRDPEIQRRFAATLDLCEAAEDMARQRFRRQNPDASAEKIEAMVVEWRREGATTHWPGTRVRKREDG